MIVEDGLTYESRRIISDDGETDIGWKWVPISRPGNELVKMILN